MGEVINLDQYRRKRARESRPTPVEPSDRAARKEADAAEERARPDNVPLRDKSEDEPA
jgi:hypothetical protein